MANGYVFGCRTTEPGGVECESVGGCMRLAVIRACPMREDRGSRLQTRAARRLIRAREVLPWESGASMLQGFHEDVRARMFPESAGYCASVAGARPAQAASA